MSNLAANAPVYGGDEINAIVLDAGSFSTRIGYAGDDFPKVVTPSFYATNGEKRIFGDAIDYPRAGFDVKPILSNSVITDWDAAIEQYRYYFDLVLAVNYSEQPILVTEPVWTEQKYRQRLVELLYELFDFPALYLAKAPTCVSFQQGRPNCLVVDIGHDSVSVTPVVDGICLLKNSMRTHYAGQYLNDRVDDFLRSLKASTENKYQVKTKVPTVLPTAASFTPASIPENITQTYDQYQRQHTLHEFKETVLEVPENKTKGSPSLKELYSDESHKRLFELPTGQSVPVQHERFELADSLFDPAAYEFTDPALKAKYPADNGELDIKGPYDDYRPLKRRKAESSSLTPAPDKATGEKHARGLSQLISQAISNVDIDLRTAVAHNIIITGGVSLIPQLTERLYSELTTLNPGLKIRLHAIGGANERSNQTWIGGSVLASLGTFHQMWVSKREYEEAGPDRILTQRFR